MDDDERIGTLLTQAVRTLDPPTERLVSGGIDRGRRRTRLYHGAAALTVLSVLGAVAALVVALVPHGSSTGSAIRPGGSPAITAAGPAPAQTVTMTPQALLKAALDTLPRPGTTTHYAGSSSPGDVSAQFVYDDGQGRAQIYVSLDYPPSGGGLGNACQISVCKTLADGNRLAVYQGNGHPGDPSVPGKDWQVTMLRTDGVAISITEFNSALEKNSPQTRPDPPFTVLELTDWVGRGWQVQIPASVASAAAGLFTPDGGH